jgi:hypothetical protein
LVDFAFSVFFAMVQVSRRDLRLTSMRSFRSARASYMPRPWLDGGTILFKRR